MNYFKILTITTTNGPKFEVKITHELTFVTIFFCDFD